MGKDDCTRRENAREALAMAVVFTNGRGSGEPIANDGAQFLQKIVFKLDRVGNDLGTHWNSSRFGDVR
jgi:hypothetical protein